MPENIKAIASEFQISGDFVDSLPYGSGHINDTFLARYDQGGQVVRYIHQRVNTKIFQEPEQLIQNIQRVLTHAETRLSPDEQKQRSRRLLTLIPQKKTPIDSIGRALANSGAPMFSLKVPKHTMFLKMKAKHSKRQAASLIF